MPVIGIISDTHGLLRPEAQQALAGLHHIIHAGDVGKPEILDELRAIAPLTAVRGNVDRGIWAQKLHHAEMIEVAGVSIFVIHDLHELDLDPAAAGLGVVVSGHSHQPRIQERKGVLYINPGSAGPRRFRLPVTLARLTIQEGVLQAQLLNLDSESLKLGDEAGD